MLIFYSHSQASKHFKCDPRTAKKNYFETYYIINKDIKYNPNTKFGSLLNGKN